MRVRKNRNCRQVAKSMAGMLPDALNGRLGVCSLLQWVTVRQHLQTVFLFVLGGLYAVFVFVCAWTGRRGNRMSDAPMHARYFVHM